jgi:hypothetical protein
MKKKKIEWVFSFENSNNKDSTTNDSTNKAKQSDDNQIAEK